MKALSSGKRGGQNHSAKVSSREIILERKVMEPKHVLGNSHPAMASVIFFWTEVRNPHRALTHTTETSNWFPREQSLTCGKSLTSEDVFGWKILDFLPKKNALELSNPILFLQTLATPARHSLNEFLISWRSTSYNLPTPLLSSPSSCFFRKKQRKTLKSPRVPWNNWRQMLSSEVTRCVLNCPWKAEGRIHSHRVFRLSL